MSLFKFYEMVFGNSIKSTLGHSSTYVEFNKWVNESLYQVGEHAIDYANVAQKEKLSELQLRVRQLLDQVISRVTSF